MPSSFVNLFLLLKSSADLVRPTYTMQAHLLYSLSNDLNVILS